MTTYRTTHLSQWNDTRRGVIELDAIARAYVGDPEVTDRDRIAFALRELRKRGYDVEARPVDWAKPLMICSLADSEFGSFGHPTRSKLYKRLDSIARRVRLITEEESDDLHGGLYPEEKLFDFNHGDSLEEPYEFDFKGDPDLVESVFQAVGFATKHEVMVPDDGSEPHHCVKVAPPTMVFA